MSKFVSGFVKVTGWLPYLLIARPKIYYQDKKVQSRKIRGKAIVMPDHHTIWDFASMMFTFPGRNMRCVVSELMYQKGKFMTGLLNGLGSIKVDRSAGDFTFMDKCVSTLSSGGVVEIYPEARLPLKGEQTPLPFKTSVSVIALNSQAPIIPVVTNGCFFGKKRLRILIGTPIDVNSLYDQSLDEKEAIQLVTERLREKIIELKYELERKTNKKEKEKK